jgi:SAM-dependent methyltransferase
MNEEYTFKINKDQAFKVKLCDGVFSPTGTSDEILRAVSKNISIPGKLLDLGCGSGVVGFALHLLGKANNDLYASDLSNKAVLQLQDNAQQLGIPVVARSGSIFEPWRDESFDYIVDDISGISEKVAEISPWFRETSCRSGEDGSDLVIDAIAQSPSYLKSGGKFFFPVLSLSNMHKIVEKAESVFSTVTRVGHREWKLPDEMEEHMDVLVDLRSKGMINFEEKYGWLLWSTDVYMAESPK